MRTLTLICFFILASTTGYSQSTDCSKFKTGTFTLYDKSAGETITIVRKGNKQIEKSESGDKVVLRVEWQDECTYVLIHKDKSRPRLIVHIDSIEGDTYKFTATAEGSTVSMHGSITRVE